MNDDDGRRLGLAAAMLLLSTALCLLLPATAARAAEVEGTLNGVQLRDGRVEVVLTTADLAPGAQVDPMTAQMTIGGEDVETTGAIAGGTAVERRLVLLIDVSGSMRGSGMEAAKAAAGQLVSQVGPDVMVGVIAFNDRPVVLAEPTTDRRRVLDALASLEASRETALYDGVQAALTSLGTTGDRTLVVLSDGGDTVSRTTLGAVTQSVATSGIRADVVGFRTDESQDAVLAGLASAGRGTVTTAQDAAGIGQAFRGVARSLSTQVLVRAEVPEGLTGLQELAVRVGAGSDLVTARGQVDLPARAAEPGEVVPLAPGGTVAGTVPPWLATPWLAVATTGLVVLLLAMLALRPLLRRRTPTRMQQLEFYALSGHRAGAVAPGKPDQRPSLAQPVIDAAEVLVRRRGLDRGLALLLDRAELPWRPGEYMILRGAAALATTAVVVVLLDGWFLAVLAPFVGWFAVTIWVRWRARRLMRRFAAQLPDALALVASSLQTGFSLNQALEAIGRDTADPLRGQVARAVAETRLGAELEDSLDDVAHRMGSDDLSWTVMAIRIQRQVGGNLAETLRTTTATIRERASLRRHVRALSADGRISAYVLVVLPFVLGAALLVVAPDYIAMLWSNPLGWLMLLAAVLGMLVGSLWMRKVVQVEM